jgi:lantibiotic modifying enzyme
MSALIVWFVASSFALDESAASSACLDETRAIARWIESTAITTSLGAVFSVAPGSRRDCADSLYSGGAGVVWFLAELGAADPDSKNSLALAKRGADYLVAASAAENPKRDYGLYTGDAGIAFVLTRVAQLTGDAKFRDAAHRITARLITSARAIGETGGIEWNDSTDVISGSAGIGFFLLARARDESGDECAAAARNVGLGLLETAENMDVGRGWRIRRGHQLHYPNFSHGTAGVATFLAELAATTHDERFKSAALDGARHLLAIARDDAKGLRVGHHVPDGEGYFYLGWCHGPVGTSRLFDSLFRLTNDPQGTTAANRCRDAVLVSGAPQHRLDGYWNNISQCCGNAGIAEYLFAHDAAERGREFVADLLARGVRDDSGLRFPQAEHRAKPELIEAQTGYMQGAAGVGILLLRMHAGESGKPGPARPPDDV